MKTDGDSTMKGVLAAVQCMFFPAVAFAGDTGYKIAYYGASIPDFKAGSDVRLYIDPNFVRIVNVKNEIEKALPPV